MNLIKNCVRTVAELFPKDERSQDAIQAFALSSAFKSWTKQYRPANLPAFARREELWDHVIDTCVKSTPVLYLEFGVFDGYSIRHFAGRLKHPDSRFVGFDTFAGLPENWGSLTAGTFDLQQNTPIIDDPRVSFRVGLFQDTLPSFLEGLSIGNRRFLIHCDADLYSSTLFVLTQLAAHMNGAIVLFDEFNALPHEFRALQDFARSYRKSYALVGEVFPRFQRAAIQFSASEKDESFDGPALASSGSVT
jgi:O-methyltransferase